MTRLALSLSLLASALPLAAQDGPPPNLPQLSDDRVLQIELLASSWRDRKARAERIKDRFLLEVRADKNLDAAAFEKGIAEAWALLESVEEKEQRRFDRLGGILDDEAASSRIDPVVLAREKAVLGKIHNLRRLMLYGNMLPRILDESVVKDGQQVGRSYASPEWAVPVKWEEGQALHWRYYPKLSRFSQADLSGPAPEAPGAGR